MHAKDKNRLQMFRRVRDLLRSGPVAPEVEKSLARFEATIDRLTELAAQQEHRGRLTLAATQRSRLLAVRLRTELMAPIVRVGKSFLPRVGAGRGSDQGCAREAPRERLRGTHRLRRGHGAAGGAAGGAVWRARAPRGARQAAEPGGRGAAPGDQHARGGDGASERRPPAGRARSRARRFGRCASCNLWWCPGRRLTPSGWRRGGPPRWWRVSGGGRGEGR
jgi:hypothetical protein